METINFVTNPELPLEEFIEKIKKLNNSSLLEALGLVYGEWEQSTGDNTKWRDRATAIGQEIKTFLDKSRNVESPYVGFCQETQLMLASMLSLTDERKKLLSFECRGSEPEYPEKILNLTWSLYGDWRTFAPGEYFKDSPKAEEIFWKLLKSSDSENSHFESSKYAGWIYNMSNTDLRISAKDFDAGVEKLFRHLSSTHECLVGGEPMQMPILIIHRTGREDCYFYDVYVFLEGQGSFVNMRYPKETPNFVKRFFEKVLPEGKNA